MSLALNALHKAIYQRLKAQLPCEVYNHAPQNAPFPYVVVGEKSASPLRTKTEDGQEITVTIHVWSQQAGDRECSELAEAVYAALDRQEDAIPVAGYGLTEIACTNTLILPYTEDQGQPDHYYHGVLRFRALVENL